MIKQDQFNKNVSSILEKMGVEKRELFKHSRKQHLVDARQILFYKCKEDGMKITYIHKYLKDNGFEVEHSTIIYGINKIKRLIKEDKDLKNFINNV